MEILVYVVLSNYMNWYNFYIYDGKLNQYYKVVIKKIFWCINIIKFILFFYVMKKLFMMGEIDMLNSVFVIIIIVCF